MNRVCLVAGLIGATLLTSVSAGMKPRTVRTQTGAVTVENLASGLDHPWGMAFLPDGRLLVTERAGRLRILGADGALSPPLEGVPAVFAKGHGGLLDVALDPAFGSNRLVYLSFAEPGDGGASIAVGRGRLADGRLHDFRFVFREQPKVSGSNQFGGRIAFSPSGLLFVTTGDRFKSRMAQDPTTHLGSVIRIRPDGTIPDDNPFVGRANARAGIWTYGHRNVAAIAFHPRTGWPWIGETGPRGGDELNILEPGRNYGWPVVNWGEHYDGQDIPDPPMHPGFAEPVRYWTPVITPSGMTFYTGDRFPQWQGSLLIGGLTSRELVRLSLEGRKVVGEERIPLGARVRDVVQAPDGSVHVLTDEEDGNVWRLVPRG